MGSGDHKLLSGDLAWEIMSDHSKHLLGSIEELIDQPDRLDPDCAEASEIAIKIEFLVAMHKAGLMRSYPHPDVVTGWRDVFFSVFDEFAENNWSDEFAKQRRKTFRSPFNKLIRACKSEL